MARFMVYKNYGQVFTFFHKKIKFAKFFEQIFPKRLGNIIYQKRNYF